MVIHLKLKRKTLNKAFQWRGYLIGLGFVILATLIGHLVQTFFTPANIIMIYPLCVTVSAVIGGFGPSILVSIMSVLAFDFFFVTPFYTFAVDDTQYIFTFIVLLLVGMTISYLTSRIRQQTEVAKLRESETAALYALGRDLAVSGNLESYIKAIVKRIREALGHEVIIFLPNNENHGKLRRYADRTEDEMGRLASILNQMITRLEKAFSRQRQFTADASHELRTPLAVIEAESTLSLRKERTESDYRRSLEVISREAVQMSALVDKLLFLARADSGKEQLNLEGVNLRSLVNNLTAEIKVLCREKGLQFKVSPLENLVIIGDKVELRQPLFNLLDNAIRYTPTGGSVSVSVERQGDTAVVAIKDSGIGIPEERIPHIFECFYRMDKARSRVEGGAGLGLAICQHIAEVHNGKIRVESQVGKGSTFSVLLPLAESNEGNSYKQK